MLTFDEVRASAVQVTKDRHYEDFAPGQGFEHHWGRTIDESDSVTYSVLTMSYTPLYFNVEYAKECGHERLVAHPNLVFLTTFGLSVEDLSEGGGPFLGVDDLEHLRPVLVGETIRACSVVLSARESSSNPGFGIVSWRTEGLVADEVVVRYVRTNLLRKRGQGPLL